MGQIRQHRIVNLQLVMLDIISLVTPEILEANKFQCTLGEAHAVIAVCWIEFSATVHIQASKAIVTLYIGHITYSC